MSHERRKQKKKLAKMLDKGGRPLPPEALRKPVYLSFDDACLLEDLLKKHDPAHKLIKKLLENQAQHTDEIARMHEIEAREKSNAWWERPEDWVNKELETQRKAYAARAKKHAQGVENIRRSNKRRKQEAVIVALPVEQMPEQLAACRINLPSNVVEQLVDLGNGHAQHPGAAGPSVLGEEGQNLEGTEPDGGGDGS